MTTLFPEQQNNPSKRNCCQLVNLTYPSLNQDGVNSADDNFKNFYIWIWLNSFSRKWQDYVYIQCEYKSTKQKIKHLLREENKVKENKIS